MRALLVPGVVFLQCSHGTLCLVPRTVLFKMWMFPYHLNLTIQPSIHCTFTFFWYKVNWPHWKWGFCFSLKKPPPKITLPQNQKHNKTKPMHSHFCGTLFFKAIHRLSLNHTGLNSGGPLTHGCKKNSTNILSLIINNTHFFPSFIIRIQYIIHVENMC